MIDLTSYTDFKKPAKTKVIMSCCVRLDKDLMLDILKSGCVFINGDFFKIPERTILDCLANKRFGDITLELEKID